MNGGICQPSTLTFTSLRGAVTLNTPSASLSTPLRPVAVSIFTVSKAAHTSVGMREISRAILSFIMVNAVWPNDWTQWNTCFYGAIRSISEQLMTVSRRRVKFWNVVSRRERNEKCIWMIRPSPPSNLSRDNFRDSDWICFGVEFWSVGAYIRTEIPRGGLWLESSRSVVPLIIRLAGRAAWLSLRLSSCHRFLPVKS